MARSSRLKLTSISISITATPLMVERIRASLVYALLSLNTVIEGRMAEFFTKQGISFTRDRMNTLSFATCPSKDLFPSENSTTPRSVRPDFYLDVMSVQVGCNILVGNDEFAHRRYRFFIFQSFNTLAVISRGL